MPSLLLSRAALVCRAERGLWAALSVCGKALTFRGPCMHCIIMSWLRVW